MNTLLRITIASAQTHIAKGQTSTANTYIYMDIYDMYTVAVQRYTFLSQQTRCAMGAGSCWTWLRFMRQSAFDKDLSSFPLLSREHGRSVSRA